MKTRTLLVRWIYLVVALHLLAGVLLPLCAGTALTQAYRRSIEAYFFSGAAPQAAGALHAWWLSLFGPTVQAAAIWMAGLAVLGDQQRNAYAWLMLILGVVVWAPQDMLISARADCWTNVWIDAAAVIVMLPPLLWLCKLDLTGKRKAG
ncbi:cell division protein [Duganella callida]|uniref:Cell division protein n=1 Tax=Duganella callida TaxID=2561932 RepID=A0A4Y9SND0_9BURK|nr:cell division protein [Duganella callida]TFW28058.1 cell division protein [Duganella callida]